MSKALDIFRTNIQPGNQLECVENTYWTREGGYGKLPPTITVTTNGPTVLNATDGDRGFRIEWPKARDILEVAPDFIRYQLHLRGEIYTTTWKRKPTT